MKPHVKKHRELYTIVAIAILVSGALVAAVYQDDSAEVHSSLYDSGYDDGYAVGCSKAKREASPIPTTPDWTDSDYVNGYRDGYMDGVYLCAA